jgi:hypothetical protein
MVKIKFQTPEQDAWGALELAKRFTVIGLPEDTYEVPAVALAVLAEWGCTDCTPYQCRQARGEL